MNSDVCEMQWTPFLPSSRPIALQEPLHGCAVWECASLSGHICDHLFIQHPWRNIQCPWSSSELHGWVLSFELSMSSRVSLQVGDRHFPTRSSQYETCSLLGDDKEHLHCIQQHLFHNWNLFSSLSSFWAQSEQNLCSGIFSALLGPWSIRLRRHKHPYSHHDAHLKISQAVQMPPQ